MPYVNGRQVAAAVKTASPSTPVILITGWGEQLTADGDSPSQVDHIMGKPPKLNELRAVSVAIAFAKSTESNRSLT